MLVKGNTELLKYITKNPNHCTLEDVRKIAELIFGEHIENIRKIGYDISGYGGEAMITDFHIHTEFSCDSEADMEQYIKQAMNKKMRMICFTEHVDFNRDDYGYNYYIPDRFFEKYNQIYHYKDCSGAYITVGSDAHEIKDIGADNDIAKELIKDFAFQEVIYEHRNRIVVTE